VAEKAPVQASSNRRKNRKEENRPFDMSKFRQRHIVIKVAYFGEQYMGLAVQVRTLHRDRTIAV
jgi:tRNA pseudouridine38/39 synthase